MRSFAIIRQIVLEHGIAAVMTMHDLNQALRYADRFILLKDGKVHAHGGSRSDYTSGNRGSIWLASSYRRDCGYAVRSSWKPEVALVK